jgi:RHH-type proline utilization regulon transcriptional repressor/proline dehydrogenase/delta 1-pyrroline-5-carboxylate dehydrogenase
MRLAEALLRVPDAETALLLTADQLKGSERQPASARADDQGLLGPLTHHVLALAQTLLPAADHAPQGWLQRLGGSAVVAATVRAVQLLGQQFVLGQDIDEALSRAARLRKQQPDRRLCFSFDMLGEGARTWVDAERYFQAYRTALNHLASHAAQAADRPLPQGTHGALGDGLSVKLSALHPRFESPQGPAVVDVLVPRLAELARLAAQAGLQLTLDAEESWRLELQLAVLDALLTHLSNMQDVPALPGWSGLGLAVQAYQFRAPNVIERLAAMARRQGRRLTVRLVKGAYWDNEIKRAQELGLPGFPVYTRKAHTDLSYLACAQQLLGHHPWLFPQFATHNAATVAAVMQLARRQQIAPDQVEWQRLHGMGEATWKEILAGAAAGPSGAPALRVYAPVGAHRDLLAYLVRRLLENGANASFVHQLADPSTPLPTLLASPLLGGDNLASASPVITPPRDLFGATRLNPMGRDIHHQPDRRALLAALPAAQAKALAPTTQTASPDDIDATMARLQLGLPGWEAQGLKRCDILERAGQALEVELESWAADLVVEGRKTWLDAIAEVRETIDYARYYAQQARAMLQACHLPGPTGERNEWRLRPRGIWVCISPWNFPLAIFGGQVMAALVTGNAVAAKPAEQTPRIARRFVDTLLQAGVPANVLACLCGEGARVGAALVRHAACAGVAFTGSVPTALAVQGLLTERSGTSACGMVPLIAETGGINAMIADSTALPEQLLDAVMGSAFGSAGQRCSALRLLCIHEAIAEPFETRLAEALQTLVVGDPADWRTDIGPVIDKRAQARLQAHLSWLEDAAASNAGEIRLLGRAPAPETALAARWPFVTPSAWSIPRVGLLTDEHFGPILHVVRWGPGCEAESLDALIDRINATGFGLTLGVHTRIDARVEHVARRARVGNVYVNRGMTGAVVGSQPFGGQGLSGTGPKAGGPLYLPRFATEQVVCINTAAAGGNAALMTSPTTR